MYSKRTDQIYRNCAEGLLTLITSPIFFKNIIHSSPSLVYPILPLYYLADAIAYTAMKPEKEGDENSNLTWTFSNRVMRNGKQFLWNVVPAVLYPALVTSGGMPLAILLTAIVVIAKASVESTYESNEYRSHQLENADNSYAVVTPDLK